MSGRLDILPYSLDVDLTDPDNPEWMEEDFARAVGPEHLAPHELAAFPLTYAAVWKKVAEGKIDLRLESKVAEALINSGEGWAKRANAILKQALNIQDDPPSSEAKK